MLSQNVILLLAFFVVLTLDLTIIEGSSFLGYKCRVRYLALSLLVLIEVMLASCVWVVLGLQTADKSKYSGPLITS